MDVIFLMLALSQTAEPGEEDPHRGRRDPCNRVRDEEAGGFVQGEVGGGEETLVCWLAYVKVFCDEKLIQPPLFAERRASQLAGTLQGPVRGDAQALPILPQEGAAQNQGGVRACAGEVPADEARFHAQGQ